LVYLFGYCQGMLSCMTQADATTIKVSKAVRDRLSRAARAQDLSANELVDRLLTEWERRVRMVSVAKAMSDSSGADMSSYLAETVLWEQAQSEQAASASQIPA